MDNPAAPVRAVEAVIEEVRRLTSQGRHVLLACEPTAEGIYFAIGIGYLARSRAELVRLGARNRCQLRLGEEIVDCTDVDADEAIALASRVYNGFQDRCGRACATRTLLACANDDPDTPEVVHQYVRLGFRQGSSIYLDAHLPVPLRLNDLARYVVGECEHTKQFVRFSRLESGAFHAVFSSKADTLPLCAKHFADRMREDAFVLLDPRHLTAVYHEPHKKDCVVAHVSKELMDTLCSEGRRKDVNEDRVHDMWRAFYRAMTLPGRDASQRGYDLRVHWMPKRFWSGLTELQPSEGTGDMRLPS